MITAHNILNFSFLGNGALDFAFKIDDITPESGIGYLDKFSIPNVKVLTSSQDDPTKLIQIPGKVSLIWGPTDYMQFYPTNSADYDHFVPGSSGSPIVYQNRVIGVITHSNVTTISRGEIKVIGVVFSGRAMHALATESNLKLVKIE